MTFILSNKLRFIELETYNAMQQYHYHLKLNVGPLTCKMGTCFKSLREFLDKMGSRKSKNSSCELVKDSWSSDLDVDKVGGTKERSSCVGQNVIGDKLIF